MTMKIPCELVVRYVLPTIRREMAIELVNAHGMPQSQVARVFGVTDAAVSQYMKRKRGGNQAIERCPEYPVLREEIRRSASRIIVGDAEFRGEVCRICGVVKELGLLATVYEAHACERSPEMTCQKVSIQQ